MKETIKLTTEELSELGKIQSVYQEKTFAFGQLYIEKLNLQERQKEVEVAEGKLKQDLVTNQKAEQSWVDKITTKYGEGNLNLKDGTFTPIDK